jgi:putative flippase GtrA
VLNFLLASLNASVSAGHTFGFFVPDQKVFKANKTMVRFALFDRHIFLVATVVLTVFDQVCV